MSSCVSAAAAHSLTSTGERGVPYFAQAKLDATLPRASVMDYGAAGRGWGPVPRPVPSPGAGGYVQPLAASSE